jgi:hydrogenase nickel incorporation protein HypA/HybF
MHELPITKRIFQIVLNHAQTNDVRRVIAVNLEVGSLSDLQSQWVQRYFDHLSRGTVVEGAALKVIRTPAVFFCLACRRSFEVASLLEEGLACKHCESMEVTMVSGREYRVKNMEVE